VLHKLTFTYLLTYLQVPTQMNEESNLK